MIGFEEKRMLLCYPYPGKIEMRTVEQKGDTGFYVRNRTDVFLAAMLIFAVTI